MNVDDFLRYGKRVECVKQKGCLSGGFAIRRISRVELPGILDGGGAYCFVRIGMRLSSGRAPEGY